MADGSAGDADYSRIGQGYREYRRPEPAFEQAIAAALGDARTVLNVGAGAGSYEPRDRDVTAVEPSASMRAQRDPSLPPAIEATAEELPFADHSFDAAMTTLSVHQWAELDRGLAEMRRVARGPVVVMTCDPARLDRTWLATYAPEMIATEARRYPAPARIAAALGGSTRVVDLPIPARLPGRVQRGLLRAAGDDSGPRCAARQLGVELRGPVGAGTGRGDPGPGPRRRVLGCAVRHVAYAGGVRRLARAGGVRAGVR